MTTHSISHLPYVINEQEDRNHFYENLWKRVALELLVKHAGDMKGWSLLDYGSGRGETMDIASRLGMKTYGLDSDVRCVELSSRYGSANLLDISRATQQVKPHSYDVVACFHVLEHVDNPKEVLTMLGRAATQYVLVAVPNLHTIPNLRKPHAPPKAVNEGHLQSWDHAHFKNLAEKHCGLELVAWANDATIVPVASELVRRTLGNKAVINLETGLFRWLFPYWGISIIALLRHPSCHS
jgi:2-polyprenyl-3-methyl-5-hydroxy-6-metoxy-1,4-benzoquinol methylase